MKDMRRNQFAYITLFCLLVGFVACQSGKTENSTKGQSITKIDPRAHEVINKSIEHHGVSELTHAKLEFVHLQLQPKGGWDWSKIC